MSNNNIDTTIVNRFGLNDEEQEIFYGLNLRERRAFNRLPDDNSKTYFIQGMVEKDRSEREKSVCLLRDTYFVKTFY